MPSHQPAKASATRTPVAQVALSPSPECPHLVLGSWWPCCRDRGPSLLEELVRISLSLPNIRGCQQRKWTPERVQAPEYASHQGEAGITMAFFVFQYFTDKYKTKCRQKTEIFSVRDVCP